MLREIDLLAEVPGNDEGRSSCCRLPRR